MKNESAKIQSISMFDYVGGISKIMEETPNTEEKQFTRKNVPKNHIQLRYDETTSTYKINFGSWFDLKNHTTIDLGMDLIDPSSLFIAIDSSESGKSLTNSLNSYFASHKDLVKKVLEHLEIKYGPINPVSEFVPIKLTHQQDFGYIFLIDKEAYQESKRPKSMLQAFGLKKVFFV